MGLFERASHTGYILTLIASPSVLSGSFSVAAFIYIDASGPDFSTYEQEYMPDLRKREISP